jgi:4a-hydroxytetrahydrobiopterin dehydratase
VWHDEDVPGSRSLIPSDELSAAVESRPGWSVVEVDGVPGLVRELRFASYADTIAFVVRLAFVAERADHHPDLGVHWGRVTVRWSTHDRGGVTGVDLAAVDSTDEIARSFPARP